MGCGSSKPYWEEDRCHRDRPVDRKTQQNYQKAYKKEVKRDRRNKYAAVTTSSAITASLGYVTQSRKQTLTILFRGGNKS
jgi:hypothetical protein